MNNLYKWIKSNWISIILLIAIAFLAWRLYFFNDTYEFLFKESIKQSEQFHKQLVELEKVNKELKENQILLEKNYKQDLLDIRSEYNVKIEELMKTRKNTQIKIIKDTNKDPNSLLNYVQDLYGIPVETK